MKIILIICLLIGFTQARRTFYGDKVLRITPSSKTQIDFLKSLTEKFELDFWKDARYIGDTVDIRVPKKFLNQFKRRISSIQHEVFVEDVQALIDQETTPHPFATNLADFDYNVYHPFEEIQVWIDMIVQEYPNLAKKHVMTTKSFEGRDMTALTISTGSGHSKFVINCGIHAREWITPASCLYAVKYLIDGYQRSESDIIALLDSVDFIFIPNSNPDGYAYTWTNDRMWRKTRSYNSNACRGVDPNRNWDVDFHGSGSSTSPCSETYRGPSPFSEKCTTAQKDFVESLENVKMYVDVHSYSQLWMFPYGYTTSKLAENFAALNGIAKDSVDAIFASHKHQFEYGPIATTIYPASGSTADYFYDVANIHCSYATELRDQGRYGFLLPEDQILPAAEETFAAFKVMAQAIADGKCDAR